MGGRGGKLLVERSEIESLETRHVAGGGAFLFCGGRERFPWGQKRMRNAGHLFLLGGEGGTHLVSTREIK